MIKYILKRILFFIPTLLAISLLTFFISINAPGDPVAVMLNRAEGSGGFQARNAAADKDYTELRHKLGFDQPLFYFSLTDATIPDTLYRISKPEIRETLKRLCNEYGSWPNVSGYFLELTQFQSALFSVDTGRPELTLGENKGKILRMKSLTNDLFSLYEQEKIEHVLAEMNKISFLSGKDNAPIEAIFDPQKESLNNHFKQLVLEKDPTEKYIPTLHWYGFNNQYHHWISNFLTGDFGISFQDKRQVSKVVYSALGKTLFISILSLLLAYAIAIPLGIHSAVHKGTKKEKSITTTLFMLYSLPNFWIATMFVVFLCGGDYLSWFPDPNAAPIPDDAPWWYKCTQGFYSLILPLFCWTYGSLAFISRQMRGGILSSISQDYIRTARAKGLDENQVIRKHALKNSMLPVITLFATIFPLAISGSFVIETIFNIPGMGRLSLDAIYARDYPVIFTVMMFTAILTMIGNLVADILYAFTDPRISYIAATE